MQIKVLNKDLGFWTEEPITVQRFEPDGDGFKVLVYCDHVEAVEEEDEVYHPSYDGHDINYTQRLLVCHKGLCKAWRRIEDKDWEDAPTGGLHV